MKHAECLQDALYIEKNVDSALPLIPSPNDQFMKMANDHLPPGDRPCAPAD